LPRYIEKDDGNDKQVGRLVCGLPPHTEESAMLPARFKLEEKDSIIISNLVVDFHNYSSDLKEAMYFILAIVLHNLEWSRTHLPKNHPFFSSRLMSLSPADLMELKGKILEPKAFFCSATDMRATGVPLHVSAAHLQRVVNDEKDAKREAELSEIKALIESRGYVYSIHISLLVLLCSLFIITFYICIGKIMHSLPSAILS